MRNGLLTDTLVTPEPTDVLLSSSVVGILMGAVMLRRLRSDAHRRLGRALHEVR
jgi:hypothetical protein